MKKFTLFLSVVLLSVFTTFAQEPDFYYSSPSEGSEFINPEQVILLKTHLKIVSINSSLFDFKNDQINIPVNIRIEGEHTLFITPENYLDRDKEYKLILKEGAIEFAKKRSDFFVLNFHTEEKDNMGLIVDFYRKGRQFDVSELQAADQLNKDYKYEREQNDNNYPDMFPLPEIINRNSPDPRPLFINMTPIWTQNYKPYIMILDTYGMPLYFKQINAIDLKILPDGNLAYCNFDMLNPMANYYLTVDHQFTTIDTVKMGNGYYIDGHDLILLSNEHYLTMAYDPQVVDMSEVVPGGQTDAVVTGLILQEVDTDQNVYWQWSSWDHYEITDASDAVDLTSDDIDYVHGNAFEFDLDSNILLSARHMDEITKINYETGDIIWRMGVKAKNNQFMFSDTVGWSHQHDIRVLPNGNMTVYDNGNLHKPFPFSQAVEYQIDQQNLTAEKVWSYKQDTNVFAFATGSNRRISENRALIGWGLGSWPLLVSEVSLDGEKHFDMLGPDSVFIYRAIKYNWDHNVFTFNKDTLDFGIYEGYTPVARTFKVANQMNDTIRITSSYNHLNDYWLVTQLPVVIAPGEEVNIIVNFQPQGTGEFLDVLTLNYDNADTTIRIARQIVLTGHTPTGVNEYQNDKISVYPNPVTDRLSLHMEFKGEKIIRVYDITGKQILDERTKEHNIIISTNNLRSGVYTGFISSGDGLATFRFVKR